MVTLDQVEELCKRTNITYEEAKAALEETDGDILEAVINLEKQNRIQAPKGGGYYSSQNTSPNEEKTHKRDTTSFKELARELLKWCRKIIGQGHRNSFEVIKNGDTVITVPVTVLALLVIFMFWVTVPLIVGGLFFNYRYTFSGPDLGKEAVNRAMDSVADAAEDLKNKVKGDKVDGKDSNH